MSQGWLERPEILDKKAVGAAEAVGAAGTAATGGTAVQGRAGIQEQEGQAPRVSEGRVVRPEALDNPGPGAAPGARGTLAGREARAEGERVGLGGAPEYPELPDKAVQGRAVQGRAEARGRAARGRPGRLEREARGAREGRRGREEGVLGWWWTGTGTRGPDRRGAS